MKNDTASGELADENWDGIGEYKKMQFQQVGL